MEPEGLIKLGVVSLGPESAYEQFRRWLDEGRHAGMEYLERHGELRADPSGLLAGARSVIVVGMPYDLGDTYPLVDGETPRVAQYARFRDYHRELRERAERLAERLHEGKSGHAWRVCVDSAPLLERALAARTAHGFIGKNTCYIHPELGSWILLGEIVTSLDLPPDVPSLVDPAIHGKEGGCGACRECQRQCPTGALDEEYRIDSRLCLSYWTIEQRGTIPEKFWPWMKEYWFGCDICQLVCPYNLRSEGRAAAVGLNLRELPSLVDTATMGQRDYESWFGGTPLTRAKREGLRRNAIIALAVTGDSGLERALQAAEIDESSVLRETAAQARRWVGPPTAGGGTPWRTESGREIREGAEATSGPSTASRGC